MGTDDVALEHLLDSLPDPYVYCDRDHVIRHMNRAARERYAGRAADVGRSIFDCHNDESNRIIVEVFERLDSGETEVLISESADRRVYMRAVRDGEGALTGYYERYLPSL